MRYVEARVEQNYRDEAYRIYVTDSLQNIPQEKYLSKRYYDIICPIQDNRSGDEIAADVINKLGLQFKKQEKGV